MKSALPLIIICTIVLIIIIVIIVKSNKTYITTLDPNSIITHDIPKTCDFSNRQMQKELATMAQDACALKKCDTLLTSKHTTRMKHSDPPRTLLGIQKEIDSTTFLSKLMQERGIDVMESDQLRHFWTVTSPAPASSSHTWRVRLRSC